MLQNHVTKNIQLIKSHTNDIVQMLQNDSTLSCYPQPNTPDKKTNISAAQLS